MIKNYMSFSDGFIDRQISVSAKRWHILNECFAFFKRLHQITYW